MNRPASRWLFDHGGIVAVAALVVYCIVAPSHLSTGDNPEFAALGTLGGAAHPPGYPLYILWLRMWSWLPGATPAHTAALATCLLGAMALLALHAACRAWGARSFAASVAVALVGAAPLAVRLHTEAEVFALNGVIAATILWLSARRGPLTGLSRAAALAFVAGLGISNHHTSVLLTPIGLLGAVRGLRESQRPAVAAASALGALALGLTPYLYLLAVSETRASWGHVDNLGELVHHFLRMDYGGPGQLGPGERDGSSLANLAAFAATQLRTFLWAPFLVGVTALFVHLARPAHGDDTRESRVAWMLLLASFLLAGPILVARFNMNPEGNLAFITQRFHLMSAIVFAVPVAVGLDSVGAWLASRVRLRVGRVPWHGAVLAALAMTALIAISVSGIARARSPAIEQALRNMLLTLPPKAVVIGTPDELLFGMGYLQGALAVRPDVIVITWQHVGLRYERDRLKRQLGISLEELRESSEQKLSIAVAEQILASGRPLYIDSFQGNIATSFPLYPEGLLYRVLPRGSAVPSIDQLFEINQAIYERYRFGYEFPHREDVVPAYFHDAYADTWRAIAVGLAREGKRDRAETARQMAETLTPIP